MTHGSRFWYLNGMLIFALACSTPDIQDPPPSLDEAPTEAEPSTLPNVQEQSDGFAYLPEGHTLDQPVVAVFMGDSITRGSGAADGRAYVDLLYNNPDTLYPDFAGQDLQSWYPSLEAGVNVAVSGGTTETVLESEIPALRGWLSDTYPNGVPGQVAIFMTVGGNDLQPAMVPFVDPTPLIERTLANLEESLAFFQDETTFPFGTRVYITNVYEPSDGVGQSSCFFGINYEERLVDLDAYNAAVHDLGEAYGVAVLDLRGHFLGHGARAEDSDAPYYVADDPTRWFAFDCIHPNDTGHHELRRLFLGAVDGGIAPFG